MAADVADQLRVLIVDDEPGALSAVGDVLEDQNYVVFRAGSGREARAAIDACTFDVALLDVRLPDARGTDLLREIRARNDATRCIMITASADAEDAINALNDGASAYIQKPVQLPHVLQTIDAVVRKYRKSAEDRRKLRDLDIVRHVGEETLELDCSRMLPRVLQSVVAGFEADGGGIFLKSDDGAFLAPAALTGLGAGAVAEVRVAVGEGLLGRAVDQNRVLSIEDVSVAPHPLSPVLNATGAQSGLAAPLVSTEGVIGAIYVAWSAPRAFSVADSHLLGVIGQRLGLATLNARLYAKEDASKQRAQYLAMVSQELNSRIGDVRAVAERVTRVASERLGEGCVVFLKRPEDGTLEAVEPYHTNPDALRLLEEEIRGRVVRVGEGPVGRVAATGESAITQEVPGLLAGTSLQDLAGEVMSVPLRLHGAILGVLSCLRSKGAPAYTPDDLRLAEECADRAAVAIDNARLLQESQARTEELQALFEMTRLVTSSLHESQVLSAVLNGTAQLMGVPMCCIVTQRAGSAGVEVNGVVGFDERVAADLGAAVFAGHRADVMDGEVPYYVPNLADVRCPKLRGVAQQHGLASLMAAPLEVDGAREGAMLAITEQPDASLQYRCGLFMTLSGLAGVAITNARSYDRESSIAERVQQWILAAETTVGMPGIDVAMDYHAALTEARVGGDFYDVFEVGRDRYGIVIGDVSGKGLSAALHTSEVRNTLRAYAMVSPAPHVVMAKTNDAVCRMLTPDIFITLFYGVLDVRQRTVRYANAGHDAPLLCHRDGSLETLDSTGRALGLLPGATYDEPRCRLHAGDVLLLYTDGVTEARQHGRFLETDGVIDLLRRHAKGSAEDVVKGIYHDVKEYAHGNLHDDIALLALKVPSRARVSSQNGNGKRGLRT